MNTNEHKQPSEGNSSVSTNHVDPLPQLRSKQVRDTPQAALGLLTGAAGLLFVALPLSLVHCNTVDQTEGDGGESSPDMSEPGRQVTCCYLAYFGDELPTTEGCDRENDCIPYVVCTDYEPECLNTADYETDPQSLYLFCNAKCDEGYFSTGTLERPTSWRYYDPETCELLPNNGAEPADIINELWNGCDATPAVGEGVDDTAADPPSQDNACPPSHLYAEDHPLEPYCTVDDSYEPPGEYPSGDIVPPTHSAFFSDRDADVDIEVAGYSISVEYELQLRFRLQDCQGGGVDGGSCTLVISQLSMDIHDIAMSEGELDFDITANMRLREDAVAEIFFNECVGNACSGDFEFSTGEGNPVDFDLVWTQVDNSTPNTAIGAIRLSNDGVSLGGVDALYGTLEVDPLAQGGYLVLTGSGEDALGGDLASVEFTTVGFATLIDNDPGDCCETHMTGGCSNEYVKVCVATREPACNLTEWDASCVTGVEQYHCGACE